MMSSFTTTNGLTFLLELKMRDVNAVRDNVKYPDGKAVDILEAAETGTLSGIYVSMETLVNTVFIICLPQIKEHFELPEYDKENEWEYELHPERKKESAVIKASRWFGSLIDGDVLNEMQEALLEAVVNFIPNKNRRAAIRMVLGKEREIERMETEMHAKVVEKMFQDAAANITSRYRAAETAGMNLSGLTPE